MNATANTTATASTDFKIFTVNARLRDYAHELHEAHGVPLQEHEEGDSFAYLIDGATESGAAVLKDLASAMLLSSTSSYFESLAEARRAIDSAIEIAQGIVARREAERLKEEAQILAWKNFWRRIVFLKPLAS